MASIAYVTDQNMIEFHRLNGNHSINFWKPSNSKKISSLNSGDLLFFLAKGSEKGSKKEKGLIGYGKFQKSYTLSFSQMWSKYEMKNGYPSKETLQEAIIKVTKNHKVPDYLNCLLLDEVVFFQYPVYLSEIGMQISNKIESYIYIDKEDMLNTSKILKIANNFGVDMWSSLFHKNDKTTFVKDAQIQTIQNIYEKIKSSYYSSYDESRLHRYIQMCIKNFDNARMISDAKSEYMEIQEETIKIDEDKKIEHLLDISNGDNELWKVEAPIINLSAPIAQDTTQEVMKKYVGHFINTAFWKGNVGLAAHNRRIPN